MAKKDPTPRSAMRYLSRAKRIALRDPELTAPKASDVDLSALTEFSKMLADSALTADDLAKAFQNMGQAIAETISQGLKTALDIKSPSKEFLRGFDATTSEPVQTLPEEFYFDSGSAASSTPPRRRN